MNRRIKGSLQMTLTAFIWGVAFVAQSEGMKYVGPWTFVCIRYILGALVLIPVIYVLSVFELRRHRMTHNDDSLPEASLKNPEVRRQTLKGGMLCGIFLCSASLFQQYGLMSESVGKSGFITALYIIIVPFLSIFLHKKVGLNEWISAFIAVAGFYIMSIQGKMTISRGDIMLLTCAFLYSMQILTIDHFVDRVNPVAMSCVQFAFSSVVGLFGMFILEAPSWSSICNAGIPILYAGVMSSGIAYTLQIVGQKNLEPTLASLLMSLESVFSAIAGYLILKQKLSSQELIGCALVFLAVILAQLPANNKS